MSPALSTALFNTAWRSLSHQAVPGMYSKHELGANGMIPRDLCPEVYERVKKTVFSIGDEAQYAVWYWIEVSGKVGWYPCVELPENRRVVVREVDEAGLYVLLEVEA